MLIIKMNITSSLKKIISLIILGFLCVSVDAYAQNITSSPYSYFGLGELMQNSDGYSTALGGTSLAYKESSVLNTNNPASLAHIDSLKFIFNIGLAAKYSNLEQGRRNDFFSDYNLTRIAFGFKVSPRYATAISISPYSSLGYEITKREKVNGDSNYLIRSLKGTGGLNQLIWSNGLEVNKNLSIGFNGIFIFGNNTRDEVINLENNSNYIYKNSSELISQGVCFNLGAQYEINIADYRLNLGMKYQPSLGVRAKRMTEVTNFSSGAGDIRYEDEDRGSFDVPETYGIGFGVNKGMHLWLGMDYLHEKWKNTKVFDKENDLVDRDKLSLGLEYNPNDGYARKFLKKLTYRVGGFYDTGYIKIDSERIDAMGMSFGLGIPMANQKGVINFSLELGITGTINNNLVREDFTRITVDVNLFERWFVKRKYN